MIASQVLVALLGVIEPPSALETRTYSIIIANNEAPGEVLRPLRYADDDGARYAELLGLLGGPVELLSVLDRETQALHPGLADRTRSPVIRELEDALDRTFRAIEADNVRGIRTVLYFIYVGHGTISSSGEGQIHLLDRRFSRSDLYHRVIDRSPARVNHIVLDACNAYFMVARRGGTEDARVQRAVDRFLDREELLQHSNTGVIVSTSKAKETHEWSRFMSGIFSHQVRSAMAGGADVDGDGVVRYDELEAFLDAANTRVTNPKARLDAYVAPPRLNLSEPVFDSRLADGIARLEIDAEVAGRMHVEDARGIRVADLHSAVDGPVTLALNPDARYFLKADEQERVFVAAADQRIRAASIEARPVDLAERGSEDEAFRRGLFAVPFGRAYFEGFRSARTRRATEGNTLALHRPSAGWTPADIAAASLGGGAILAATTGVVLGILASNRASSYRTATGAPDEIAQMRSDSESFSNAANALYVTGAGLAAAGLSLWLLQ